MISNCSKPGSEQSNLVGNLRFEGYGGSASIGRHLKPPNHTLPDDLQLLEAGLRTIKSYRQSALEGYGSSASIGRHLKPSNHTLPDGLQLIEDGLLAVYYQ